MNTNKLPISLPEVTQAWTTFQDCAGLRPIRDAADFHRIQALANILADEVGDDDEHPLYSLFEIVLEMIERWEFAHVQIAPASPREVLRHLLEANNLKQKDLADMASQTLVSDILAGRREISKRLAKALAARFHVNVSAFI
ncbi:helix-turn-helix domain-containing protein [Oxalobacteraceae bacterium]|nr:helix-turn-helix domain-containing protein [Oxalobacteraceae bacterium]